MPYLKYEELNFSIKYIQRKGNTCLISSKFLSSISSVFITEFSFLVLLCVNFALEPWASGFLGQGAATENFELTSIAGVLEQAVLDPVSCSNFSANFCGSFL